MSHIHKMTSQNKPQWQSSGASNPSQYHSQHNMKQGPNFSYNQEQQGSHSHGQGNRGPDGPPHMQSSVPQYPPSAMPGQGPNQHPPFHQFLPPAPSSGPPPPVPAGQQSVPMAPPQAGFGHHGFPYPPPFPPQPGQHGERQRTNFPNPMQPPPFHQQQSQAPQRNWNSSAGPHTNQQQFQPPTFPPAPPQQNPNSWSNTASNDIPGQSQWQHQLQNNFNQQSLNRYERPPNQETTQNKMTPQGKFKHNNSEFKSALQPYQSHRIRMPKKENQTSTARSFQQGYPTAGFQGMSAGDDHAQPLQGGEVPGDDHKEKVEESPDQKWVNQWLSGVSKQPQLMKKSRKPTIKIGEAKAMLAKFQQFLKQLKEKRDEAAACILDETDPEKWNHRCQQMKEQMNELSSLRAIISEPEFVQDLKGQIEKRKKNRERNRRRRQEEWEAREEEIKSHTERIDSRMAEALQAVQDREQEKALQKEVDNTLSEVRKKKQDANKSLELLRALRKLRNLRKESAEKRGYRPPKELDVRFEKKVSSMEEMMNKQKLLYVDEERALQVMLEEEHEETRERERQKKRLKEQRKAKRAWDEQMERMFGKTEELHLGHPLFMYRQFHQQANHDIQSLINIRRQWDTFIVPESDAAGSCIPVSWVTPPEPANHIWATALEETSGS